MIVQWCVKGLGLDNDDQAKDIIDGRHGIQCNWWRTVHKITAAEWQDRLTRRISIAMSITSRRPILPAASRSTR